jgi:hypothetical protein
MTRDEELAVLKAQNAELVAVNGALAARVQELAAQNAELRARLAKDSHNSGKPLYDFRSS